MDGSSRTHLGRIAAIRKLVRQEQPDVAVVCGLVDAMTAVAREKRNGLPIRLICVAHGISAGPFSDFRRFRSFVDGAVGVSVLSQRLFIDWVGIEPNRTDHITNGAMRLSHSKPREVKSGALKLAYAGRLEQSEKKIHDLPVLVRLLDESNIEYSLRIAGDGPERDWLLSQLPVQIKNGTVEYLGWLGGNELQDKVYSWADGALVFSPAEGSCPPISLAEAMHCGCIPISSQFLGLVAENLLKDKCNALLFPVGDMTAACRQIAAIANDRAKLASLSANALATARERLCLDNQLKRWCRFFEFMLERPALTPQAIVPSTSESSGRLERWKVPTCLATPIRRWFSTRQIPQEPGAEWPHHGTINSETKQSFELALEDLDTLAWTNSN